MDPKRKLERSVFFLLGYHNIWWTGFPIQIDNKDVTLVTGERYSFDRNNHHHSESQDCGTGNLKRTRSPPKCQTKDLPIIAIKRGMKNRKTSRCGRFVGDKRIRQKKRKLPEIRRKKNNKKQNKHTCTEKNK